MKSGIKVSNNELTSCDEISEQNNDPIFSTTTNCSHNREILTSMDIDTVENTNRKRITEQIDQQLVSNVQPDNNEEVFHSDLDCIPACIVFSRLSFEVQSRDHNKPRLSLTKKVLTYYLASGNDKYICTICKEVGHVFISISDKNAY